MNRLEEFLTAWRLSPAKDSPVDTIVADIEIDRLHEVAAAARRDHAASLAMIPSSRTSARSISVRSASIASFK